MSSELLHSFLVWLFSPAEVFFFFFYMMTILHMLMRIRTQTHAISCPYIAKPSFPSLLRRRQARSPIRLLPIVTQCVGLLSVFTRYVIRLQINPSLLCDCVLARVRNGPRHLFYFIFLSRKHRESFYESDKKKTRR